MKKILTILCLFFALCYTINAQQRTISGVVLDGATKEPLIGVSVTIKKTTEGQMTDTQGHFSMPVSTGQTLVFKYLGMIDKEVNITASTKELTVELQSNAVDMDEVVVVGYGVTRKRDIAGSMSSLKRDDIKAGVVPNMGELLKGRASGVQVKQNSLEPGGGMSIRIRGASSISADNDPLYVVDGFQTNDMTLINPDDIESIEILKDAATTAIYGARGANGVVLITTKKGQSGKFSVDYSYSASVRNMYNPWDLLNAEETVKAKRKIYLTDPTITSDPYPGDQANFTGKGTDWLDETTRTAVTQSHQVSVSGGSDKLTSFASLNYYDEPGILLNTNYERYGGRVTLDYKPANIIRFGATINLVHSDKRFQDMGKESASNNIMYKILKLEPTKTPGDYNVFGYKERRPGIFDEMNGSQLYQKGNNMYGSAYAEIDILPTLTGRVQYTYAYDHFKVQKYYDRSTNRGKPNSGSAGGQAFSSHEETTKHQLEATLTWHQKFDGRHDVKLLGGTSYINQTGEADEIQAYGFASDVFSFNNLGAAEHIEWIGSGTSTIKKASYFARAEYVLDNKYIVNASIRGDGASVFGPDNKWGYFPSASVAWQLGDESFMDFIKPVFSSFKLRASYGLSGNDGIRFGQSQFQYSVRDTYIGGSGIVKGMYPSNVANTNLKWETTSQLNIGTDFTLLDGRFEVNFDYYLKKTKDLLNPVPIHPFSGSSAFVENGMMTDYTARMENDGEVQNRGVELFIKSNNFMTKDFTWITTFNLTHNKSKVLKINNGKPRYEIARPMGWFDEKEYVILQEGYALSSIYGYEFDGIIQNGETYSAQPGSVAGDPKFKNLDGDGTITEKDRKVLGKGTPNVILGLGNTFNYKDFDFSFFFEASLGNHMLNLTRIYLEDNIDFNIRSKDGANKWTPGRVFEEKDANGNVVSHQEYPGNPSNEVPRNGYRRNSGIQYGSYVNSRFVEDASYLKLRNVELGYTLPLKKMGILYKYIKGLRVFVGAQNLFTITSYTGFDPDISTNGGSATAQGLDLNSYPAYRMYNFGAKVTF